MMAHVFSFFVVFFTTSYHLWIFFFTIEMICVLWNIELTASNSAKNSIFCTAFGNSDISVIFIISFIGILFLRAISMILKISFGMHLCTTEQKNKNRFFVIESRMIFFLIFEENIIISQTTNVDIFTCYMNLYILKYTAEPTQMEWLWNWMLSQNISRYKRC